MRDVTAEVQLQEKAVNITGHNKCWCLMCDKKHATSSMAICPWFYYSKLVCTYMLCDTCLRKMLKATAQEKIHIVEQIEDEIVSRYPDVLSNLDDSWKDHRD